MPTKHVTNSNILSINLQEERDESIVDLGHKSENPKFYSRVKIRDIVRGEKKSPAKIVFLLKRVIFSRGNCSLEI